MTVDLVVSSRVPIYLVRGMDALIPRAFPDRSALIRRGVCMIVVNSPVSRNAMLEIVDKMRLTGTLKSVPEELKPFLPMVP